MWKPLEAVFAKIAQAKAIRENRLGQDGSRLGEEYLASVARVLDARALDDIESRVTFRRQSWLTRVDPDTYPERDILRPPLRREVALGPYGRRYCLCSARKDDEKRVTLCIDLIALLGCKRGSEQCPMGCQCPRVALSKLHGQKRTVLDVRMEKGERAVGQLPHATTLSAGRPGRSF